MLFDKYASWAPPDAIQFFEEKNKSWAQLIVENQPQEYQDFFCAQKERMLEQAKVEKRWLIDSRMIIENRAVSAWEILEENSISTRVFMMWASHALNGPPWPYQYRYTPKEQEEWIADIQKTASHLADLIEFTYFENYVSPADLTEKPRRYAVKPDFDKKLDGFLCFVSHFSGILRGFSQHAPRIHASLAEQYHPLKKATDATAAKRFFAIKMTNFCIENCGKPLRPVVAAFTATAFNEDTDSRQIRRWLSDKPDTF